MIATAPCRIALAICTTACHRAASGGLIHPQNLPRLQPVPPKQCRLLTVKRQDALTAATVQRQRALIGRMIHPQTRCSAVTRPCQRRLAVRTGQAPHGPDRPEDPLPDPAKR